MCLGISSSLSLYTINKINSMKKYLTVECAPSGGLFQTICRLIFSNDSGTKKISVHRQDCGRGLAVEFCSRRQLYLVILIYIYIKYYEFYFKMKRLTGTTTRHIFTSFIVQAYFNYLFIDKE